MKGAAFILLCAVALASAEFNKNGCPINPYIDVLIPHPHCNKFYQCLQGDLLERKCASTLAFNVETQECDWPENVDCENRIPVAPVSSEEAESEDSSNGNGGDDPSKAPEICAAENSDGTLVAHEQCNKFYQCHNGVPVAFACAPLNLVFNPSTEACDWPENVNCGNRVPGGDGDSGNGDGGNGDSDNGDGGNGDGGNGDGNGDNGNGENNNSTDGDSGHGDGDNANNGGGGNGNPAEALEICAAEGSDGVLVAHENCNQFYKCSEGKPVALICYGNLLFNPNTDQCDWPENVSCGGSTPDGGNGDNANGDGGNGDNDSGNGDGGNADGGNEDHVGGGNGDPSDAPKICAADGSDGVLVAHENCNQFYKCSEGKPVALICYGNLLFNPNTDQCDWPVNVSCGGSTQDGGNDDNANGDGGNGGNDSGNGDGGNADGGNGDHVGGGNGDPSEAPKICAAHGSDGVLVANENCNQFYKCSEGKPVALVCYGNLLFNPNSDQCDWPENVDCNGRSTDSSNGNGGNANGDIVSNVGGTNGNPSEAPEICAAHGSDGVLVAHENCNQFYKCSEGKPVVLTCQPTLLFNPNNDQCDWPENVDCSGRNPDSGNGDGGNGDGDNGNGVGGGNGDPSDAPKICAAHGSDGVLVAHENCNQFYKCSEGNPVVLTCQPTLLFNPNNDQCDWPENVDCNGRSTDSSNGNGGNANGDIVSNVGGTNGNPSEAPEICAAHGSDGVLVAHENCNQFYKCSEGKPVVLTCQPTLLFNPNNDQCDWPENVDCSGRNPDSGNGDGGNGDGDNGSGVGGGNGDPSDAPKICAAHGSDGVLVAHENCNQFYKCSEGNPVVLTCQPTLLFNPNNDQCDWPENVDCNGRSTDSSNGNGGNANGDIVSNVGGTNGNPSEAPEICAAHGSDGVLVAHENCNQFYKCSEGKPVVLTCQPTLLFNPNNDQCDWPENVDCSGRNPDSGNGDGGNGDGDNGNGVGGGNGDPSDAPKICAAHGSDGVLVAHENCNQFYKCSEGNPVVLTCQPTLLFNPNNDQCDWPENVDCNGRSTDSSNGNGGNANGDIVSNVGGTNGNPSEAPEICAAHGSDGVLVAHENCNQFYKCSEGKPVVLTCQLTLLFNPNNDQCDWPENVDCNGRNPDSGNGDGGNGDGDNGNSVGGGNGDPSDAPKICAAHGSDGVLVAHENCNQFYQCSEGKPVALTCHGNLMFNPNNDQCDWPENVNCGTRYIFTSFNKHLRRFVEHFRA